MKVKQLCEVFQVAETQWRHDGKTDAADALSAFATNLLKDNKDASVADFVKRVEKAKKSLVLSRNKVTGTRRSARNRG